MTFWFCEVYGQQSSIFDSESPEIGGVRFFGPPLEPEEKIFAQNQSFTLNYTIKDEKSTINMGGYLSKKIRNKYLKVVRA